MIYNYVYQVCDLVLQNVIADKESQVYVAHQFEINQQKALFRVAKVMLTKTVQFTSI